MRRIFVILGIFLILSFFAFPVEAGILAKMKDFFVEQTLIIFITGVFAVIAAVFGKKYMRFKKPVLELIDVYKTVQVARHEKSEQGKKISPKEWEKIWIEIAEAIGSIIEVAPESWAKKIKKDSS